MIEEDYSSKSDAVTVMNKSSMPVEIFLDIQIEPNSLDRIVTSEDRNFTNGLAPGLYLVVTDGESEMPIGKDGITIPQRLSVRLTEKETGPDRETGL